MVTQTQRIVDVLNDAFRTDPNAIDALLQACAPCNAAMRDHPTIQVHCKNDNGDLPVVRMLGLLNAITVALDGQKICAIYDVDSHCLLGFGIPPKK